MSSIGRDVGAVGEVAEKDRKAEIREKARAIFIRHGYRKTTVEDIGKACGLGKAALYHYFRSKEEIFAEVVRVEGEILLSRMRRAAAEAEGPREQLIAILRTRLQAVSDLLEEVIGDLAGEIRELYPHIATVREKHMAAEVELLGDILRKGHEQGVFKEVRWAHAPAVMIAGPPRCGVLPRRDLGDLLAGRGSRFADRVLPRRPVRQVVNAVLALG